MKDKAKVFFLVFACLSAVMSIYFILGDTTGVTGDTIKVTFAAMAALSGLVALGAG